MPGWDIPAGCLYRQHLLGDHPELHVLWIAISEQKAGCSGSRKPCDGLANPTAVLETITYANQKTLESYDVLD